MVLSPLLLLLLLLLTSPPSQASLPQPALAAAEPVLQGRPFVVVWNMPTERCSRLYDVHLDLHDFDIVANQRQDFQGQKMTIFYRDHLGKYPYLTRDGERVNGGLPQLGDLDAHLALAEAQISALLRPGFEGLAVIDWEEWRPLWEHNFGAKDAYRRQSKALVRERGDLPEWKVSSAARREFQEAARGFMSDTLRLATRERPRGLWGYYGFPYCYNSHLTVGNYTGLCHPGTSERNDRLAWLWRRSTALYPSIYLPARLERSRDAALMVRHRLREALRVASRWRHSNNTTHATPVLPYSRLAFIHTHNFLSKTDLEHTLGESAALGAAGVVLWGELKFAKSKRHCIQLRDYIHSVLGRYIQSLKSAAWRCGLQRCHGNGRCARRRPSSGRLFSSVASPATPDPDRINFIPDDHRERRGFHDHFLCQCYPGWTGERCQWRYSSDNNY